jgi:hypothetical protein
MVMNDLYRMEDKQVETLFSFDEEVLKKALKNIYSKDFHPLTEIEENLFEATWKTINEAADKGFGTRKPDDPDYDFYREIRANNAVFAAFKVHRAQNDMAALLLDENGNLRPFEQWLKLVMPIANHQMVHWLRTEYDTAVIRAHQAADLAAHHEVVARAFGEQGAEAVLGARVAVERRRVEITDSGIPGAGEDIGGVLRRRRTIEPAHLRAAQAQGRQLQIDPG